MALLAQYASHFPPSLPSSSSLPHHRPQDPGPQLANAAKLGQAQVLAAALTGQVPAAPGTLAAAAATLTVSTPTNVVLLENMVSCGTIRDEQEKKEVRARRFGDGVVGEKVDQGCVRSGRLWGGSGCQSGGRASGSGTFGSLRTHESRLGSREGVTSKWMVFWLLPAVAVALVVQLCPLSRPLSCPLCARPPLCVVPGVSGAVPVCWLPLRAGGVCSCAALVLLLQVLPLVGAVVGCAAAVLLCAGGVCCCLHLSAGSAMAGTARPVVGVVGGMGCSVGAVLLCRCCAAVPVFVSRAAGPCAPCGAAFAVSAVAAAAAAAAAAAPVCCCRRVLRAAAYGTTQEASARKHRPAPSRHRWARRPLVHGTASARWWCRQLISHPTVHQAAATYSYIGCGVSTQTHALPATRDT